MIVQVSRQNVLLCESFFTNGIMSSFFANLLKMQGNFHVVLPVGANIKSDGEKLMRRDAGERSVQGELTHLWIFKSGFFFFSNGDRLKVF